MTDFEVSLDLPLHGEDAPPRIGRGYVIVCDGLGSGALKVEYGGETHTGAYFASRIVSETVSSFIESDRDRFFDADIDETLSELKEKIKSSLSEFVSKAGINPEGIGGNMFKILPTTLACIVFRETEGGVDTQTVWVGDSRCYCMDPSEGLRQISDDDIKVEKNPMDCLIEDTPMSNTICYDKDFHINHVRHSFDAPCLLFAASDGCYGYLDSPMDLEGLLLPSGAAEEFNLTEQLHAQLSTKKFDDRSLAGVCFGIEDDAQYAKLFSDRASMMRDQFFSKMIYKETLETLNGRMKEARALPKGPERNEAIAAVRAEMNPIKDANTELMVGLWGDYKGSYDALRLEFHAKRIEEREGPEPWKNPTEESSEEEIHDAGSGPTCPVDGSSSGGAETPCMTPAEAASGTGACAEEGSRTADSDPLDRVIRAVESMTRIDKYVINTKSIVSHGHYVCAGASASAPAHGQYRMIFKPRSKFDENRMRLFRSETFIRTCGKAGVLQVPVYMELTPEMLIMVFNDKCVRDGRSCNIQAIREKKDKGFIDLAVQFMTALDDLHSINIVHGDIGLDNVTIMYLYKEAKFKCRINNYARSFLKSGAYCDFDWDASVKPTAYDIECLAMMLFTLRHKEMDGHPDCTEDVLKAMGSSTDRIDRVLFRMVSPDRKISLRDAIKELESIRNRR